MAERKMLIVVGAGASTECGLPTGKQLKATIAYLLDMEFGYGITKGDEVIWEAIKIAAQRANDRDLNAYAHAARQIRNAMPQAI